MAASSVRVKRPSIPNVCGGALESDAGTMAACRFVVRKARGQLGHRQVGVRTTKTGPSLNRLNEIVLGKRGITADTAIRLARLLKTSPQFWMRLQADWDLHQALTRSAEAS
jgi:hypothetical protein